MAPSPSAVLTEDLFPQDAPDSEDERRWFVLHTRSRQEKAVADDLVALRVPHFLPLVNQARYYGRRKVRVDMPLFPGYVFLFGRAEQAFEMDRNKRLANIIRVADQEQIDWELRNLRMALGHQAPLDPHPALKKGVRVEVRSGPFRGLQGVVEDRTKADRIIVQVQMLGRGAAVELDGAVLEVIE